MTDPSVLSTTRNAFQQTLVGLEYEATADRPADLFSRACVEQYRDSDPRQFGYLFAQVFEPEVLREVALLEGVPFESLDNLEHRPTATLKEVGKLVDSSGDLGVVELVNLAAALISISRFTVAERILTRAAELAADARERFEVAMLEFVVSNRRDDGAASQRAFRRMRAAIETGPLPPDRVMDACAQGVVWFLKRRELSEDDFNWFVATGSALAARPGVVEPAALSSWYRGLAMIPAAKGEKDTTRRYMEHARDAAQATITKRPRAYEMHLMKTYHESSLKEHMYLTRDLDRAEESGRALIAIDPAWSPSYGELAEAYVKFGRLAQAAELFETAAAAGPPYVGHHVLWTARCHERLGDDGRALTHYLRLVDAAEPSEQVVTAALALARKISHPDRTRLEAVLDRLRPGSTDRAAAGNN